MGYTTSHSGNKSIKKHDNSHDNRNHRPSSGISTGSSDTVTAVTNSDNYSNPDQQYIFFGGGQGSQGNLFSIPRHHMYAIWILLTFSFITAIFLPTPEEISNKNEYSWVSTGRLPDSHAYMNRNVFSEEDINATETIDSDPIPFSALYDEDDDNSSDEAEWFTQTIVQGDNINNIFRSLNQPYAVLKAMEQVPQYGQNISIIKPGNKLYFLFNNQMQILQMVKPYDKQHQLRFIRPTTDSLEFTAVIEPIDAHLTDQNDDEVKSTTEIAVQPQNQQSAPNKESTLTQTDKKETVAPDSSTPASAEEKARREQELAKKKAAEEARKKAALEAELARKKAAEEKRQAEERARREMLSKRKELVVFKIQNGDTFNKAAQRAGLTKDEAYKITNLYKGRLQPKNLRPGDEVRVLFTSSKPNSKINAVSINSQKNGRLNAFRDPSSNSYLDDTGIHTKKSTKFNRYPIAGQIRITSHFNPNRQHPITRKVRPHNGTDFGVKVGTPIFAPADGVVTKATFQNAAGNYIVIQHKGDYSTVYMHLSKILVKPGQRVRANDRIALSGNTGASTGPHLHYEVRIKGVPVDALRVSLPSSGAYDSSKENKFKTQIAEYKRRLGIK